MAIPYNIGDFVRLPKKISEYPGVITDIYGVRGVWKEQTIIIAVCANSDDDCRGYYWPYRTWSMCARWYPIRINLRPADKLYCLSIYGAWFYSNHKSIYQSIIIENLCS